MFGKLPIAGNKHGGYPKIPDRYPKLAVVVRRHEAGTLSGSGDSAGRTELARRTDPITSHEAAAIVRVSPAERAFLEALSALGAGTAYDVADAAEYPNSETIRKRAGGLKAKGLIVVDGYGEHPQTGNRCERLKLAPSRAAKGLMAVTKRE